MKSVEKVSGFKSVHDYLGHLDRAVLLMLVMRALEIIPRSKWKLLLEADFTGLPSSTQGEPLAEEVRRFCEASRRGAFYEDSWPNRNRGTRSYKTDRFMADLDRLLRRCTEAEGKKQRAKVELAEVRAALEQLFSLIRHIDEGYDDVVDLGDEAGSWQLPIQWDEVLEVYFRCLAATAGPEEYACGVERVVSEQPEFYRPKFIETALRVASGEQRRLCASRWRR